MLYKISIFLENRQGNAAVALVLFVDRARELVVAAEVVELDNVSAST